MRNHSAQAKVNPFVPNAPFLYSLKYQKILRLQRKNYGVVGNIGMKLALTYKKLTLFKVLSQKKYTELIVILIGIVNVLFTLFIVKYVTYSMLSLRMTNFVYGGTIINVINR